MVETNQPSARNGDGFAFRPANSGARLPQPGTASPPRVPPRDVRGSAAGVVLMFSRFHASLTAACAALSCHLADRRSTRALSPVGTSLQWQRSRRCGLPPPTRARGRGPVHSRSCCARVLWESCCGFWVIRRADAGLAPLPFVVVSLPAFRVGWGGPRVAFRVSLLAAVRGVGAFCVVCV